MQRRARRYRPPTPAKWFWRAKLFYEGNCVIVNHGQQFLTIYMHLSQIVE